MEWWEERCRENLAYDAKLDVHKEEALQKIQAIVPLTPKEAEAVREVLHELISSTIVTSGGAFHTWTRQAR